MKHVIIGRGNLGLDLAQVLSERGDQTKVLSRSSGYDWRRGDPAIYDADFVWVTAGNGSIDEAMKNPSASFETHVLMPVHLAQIMRDHQTLVCFSSDYAASELQPWSPGMTNLAPKNLYSVTKVSMELSLRSLGRKNTFCVRVCSLYGEHFADKTFPGRLLKRYPNPCKVLLPMNRTTPTPTPWIAHVLSRHLHELRGDFRIFHCAPKGMSSVVTWGKIILGESYDIESKGLDPQRPLCSNLQCSFENPPEWEELWRLHWLQQRYHAKTPVEPAVQERVVT